MSSPATRARAAAPRISAPVRRILAHSLLFGLAGSIADLLFNFYLVSLGYDAAAAGLLSTVYRTAGVALGLPIGLLIDRAGAHRSLLAGVLLHGLSWGLVLLSRSIVVPSHDSAKEAQAEVIVHRKAPSTNRAVPSESVVRLLR